MNEPTHTRREGSWGNPKAVLVWDGTVDGKLQRIVNKYFTGAHCIQIHYVVNMKVLHD